MSSSINTPVKHYCNVTFLTVGDLGPDGMPIKKKLLRCTRCQETYYCGPKQQRSHWKMHKKFCNPRVEGEEELWQQKSTVEVLEAVHEAFHGDVLDWLRVNGLSGRSLVYALQRLERLLLCSHPDITEADYPQLGAFGSGFSAKMVSAKPAFEELWAIPGMTTYLLNLELRSDVMKKRKLAGQPPTSNQLQSIGFDRAFQVPNFFPFLMCRFLGAVIAYSPRRRVYRYRNTPLAAAAARRMMKWYMDPYTRASIPSAPVDEEQRDLNTFGHPRDGVMFITLKLLLDSDEGDPSSDQNIVPGVTAKDCFSLFVTEPAWKFKIEEERGALEYYTMAMTNSLHERPEAWEAFSVYDRAVALHQVGSFFVSLGRRLRNANSFKCLLLELIAGNGCQQGGTRTWNGALWLKVIKLAKSKAYRNGKQIPFGPHTEMFQCWYDLIIKANKESFDELTKIFPPSIAEHIIEFTLKQEDFEVPAPDPGPAPDRGPAPDPGLFI